MTELKILMPILALCVAMAPVALAAQPPGHVTGVGGVFVRAKDPKALMAWYRDVLGIEMQPWGGAMLSYDAPAHPPVLVLNAFGEDSDYMAPSERQFMLNFAIDDMDALLARARDKGVAVLKVDDSDPSGRFAWIMDPEGTKIELWQPNAE